AHAQHLADPRAEAEPDVLVRVDVELELVAVADVAEHPAVEGDDVDRQRQRRRARRGLAVDQRSDRVAVGIDELADVDPRLRPRPVDERARGRAQPLLQLVGAETVALRISHGARVYRAGGETKSCYLLSMRSWLAGRDGPGAPAPPLGELLDPIALAAIVTL